MCVKLSSKNLNFGFCPPHSTSTYTYGVTIAPRVCGREKFPLLIALCFVEIDNAIYIHELVVVFFFSLVHCHRKDNHRRPRHFTWGT